MVYNFRNNFPQHSAKIVYYSFLGMDLLKILFKKRHPNSCKCDVCGWVSYDFNKPETRPTKYGKYFVHRKDGKIHWETWNGSGWAYNGNEITFWMEVIPPCH